MCRATVKRAPLVGDQRSDLVRPGENGQPSYIIPVSKVESILEKKIDLRYSVGAGGRYRSVGTGLRPTSTWPCWSRRRFPERRQVCRRKWSPNGPPAFVSNAGLTAGASALRPRPRIEPEVRELGVFTVTSRSSLAFQLSQRIGVQFSRRQLRLGGRVPRGSIQQRRADFLRGGRDVLEQEFLAPQLFSTPFSQRRSDPFHRLADRRPSWAVGHFSRKRPSGQTPLLTHSADHTRACVAPYMIKRHQVTG